MISYTFHRDPPSTFPVVTIPRISRACSLIKKTTRSNAHEVGVSFVSESEMTKMNHQYRGLNRPTDVLSFSSLEGDAMPHIPSQAIDLGDIVICSKIAAKEAKRRGIGTDEELVRLLVHGTLHLLGYDHADDRTEVRMFSIQEEIVEKAMSIV